MTRTVDRRRGRAWEDEDGGGRGMVRRTQKKWGEGGERLYRPFKTMTDGQRNTL